jgi:3-oxoacyl-[acyl-carrier protein] reductase
MALEEIRDGEYTRPNHREEWRMGAAMPGSEVAWITGASRGIGRAIAVALAHKGAAVALFARGADGLYAVAHEISACGGRAVVAPLDVADEGGVLAAIEQALAALGAPSILVNCAGIGVFRPVLETTVEEWDRVMAVNARGAFLMCRAAAPHMVAAGQGCIINIASVVSVKGYVNQGAYTASKHALLGLTKVLAQELQPHGVRVHAVCPGGVDTDLIADARPDLDRSALMRPEEIADLVVFLASQRGQAIVDQINVRRATSAPWFE